jgi:hypothetical protein
MFAASSSAGSRQLDRPIREQLDYRSDTELLSDGGDTDDSAASFGMDTVNLMG